jgi:cytoskeleton protein RodZ
MATVGEIFKKARREQKLTLKKVAEKIKVRKDYLLALEENRYQDLPSAVYIQGFIRNYSQILGLKAEPLLAKFRRDYKEKKKSFLSFAQPKGFYWTPRLTVITFVIFFLLLFFGYLFWQYRFLLQSPYRP